MTMPLTPRQTYDAKRAHPEAFTFFWPRIGTPLRRECVDRWGDFTTPKMAAFVGLN